MAYEKQTWVTGETITARLTVNDFEIIVLPNDTLEVQDYTGTIPTVAILVMVVYNHRSLIILLKICIN